MKIYFSAAISAGRTYAPIYQKIVEILKKEGHTVLTEHVAAPNVLDLEEKISAEEVYTRDIEKLNEADLLIAEVSVPSTGVGYELAYFLSLEKPVVCFYAKELNMSKMITGNTEPLFSAYAYESEKELVEKLRGILPVNKKSK